MRSFSVAHLKGKFVIAQRAQHYTHLISNAHPVRLIIARNPQRRPCQNGYQLSTAFLRDRRIALDIELYRHPDQPNHFEFAYEDRYFRLALDASAALIEPIGT